MSSLDLAGRLLCSRYRVGALISTGGMGEVYRATDEQLGRPVALKVIGRHPAEKGDKLRARFRREIEALGQLDHANVVRFYGADTDEESRADFMVMELLRGEDLRSRLARRGPLPLRLAVRLLYQAARGLGAGHRLGMVHRDVKPANLFLERVQGPERVRTRVLDFGAVQLLGDGSQTMHQLTVHGDAPHTVPYAAPEQLRGHMELRYACDVFALGITAYEAITGVRPFSDEDRDRMRRGDEVPPPSLRARIPTIPAGLDRVIARALEPRIANRFADGDDFASALRDAVRPRRAGASAETQTSGDIGALDEARSAPPPQPRDSQPGPASSPPPTGAPRTYEPLPFWTDLDEEVEVSTPAELAELLERNPKRGRVFLYERVIDDTWGKVNSALRVALAGITQEYPNDRDAGLACAIYTLDRRHPYRAGGAEATTCLALADHLLENAETYRDALRTPKHRLWLYLGTRREPAVREGVQAFVERFAALPPPDTIGGASPTAELHRLVVWLRAQEGETRLYFSGTLLSEPRELAALSAGGRAEAAAALADPSSLISAWASARAPEIVPLVERWRAMPWPDPRSLDYALGFGVRVGPGEIRTPADAVSGDAEVMAALWSGGEEARDRVEAYLEQYHDVSLVRTAFVWLRDDPRSGEPHRLAVQRYVAEQAHALVPLLSTAYPAAIDAEAETVQLRLGTEIGGPGGAGRKDARVLEQVEPRIAGEPWLVLPREVLPVLLLGIPTFVDDGEQVASALAITAAKLLDEPSTAVPVRLYRLGIWMLAVGRGMRASAGDAAANHWWRRFLERMDTPIAEAYRAGFEEVGDSLTQLRIGAALMRHAIAPLSKHGPRMPFLDRWLREEAVHQVHAAHIEQAMGGLRKAAALEVELDNAAALHKRRTESAAIADLRAQRSRTRWQLAALAGSVAIFFFFAPPLWDSLVEGLRAESSSMDPWWREVLMETDAYARNRRWYIAGAYLIPLVLLAAAGGIASQVVAGVGGILVLASIILLPGAAAVAAPLAGLALLGVLAWRWMVMNRQGTWIAREFAAVAQEPAYVGSCDSRRAASERKLSDAHHWCTLADRRAIALADDPERAATLPTLSNPSRTEPRGRAAAVQDWMVEHPRRVTNGALAAGLLVLAVTVMWFAPHLPWWLTAREPHYVWFSAFSRSGDETAKELVRQLRATPGLSRVRLLDLGDETFYTGQLAVVLGPMTSEGAERIRAEAGALGIQSFVYDADDLGFWWPGD